VACAISIQQCGRDGDVTLYSAYDRHIEINLDRIWFNSRYQREYVLYSTVISFEMASRQILKLGSPTRPYR